MDATSFELSVLMPRERRFAEAVRRLAVHAAEYAGCATGAADPFGHTVERAFLACMQAGADADVSLRFRRASGPLEVVVDSRVFRLPI